MINRIVLSLLSVVIFLSLMAIIAYIPTLSFINVVDKEHIPMAPSTSLSFLFSSITLLIISGSFNTLKPFKTLFIVSVFIVGLFGLLELLGTFFGVELNFESYIIPIVGELNGIPIARMSLVTGLCFFLSSSILLIMHFHDRSSPSSKRLLKVKNTMIVLLLLISFIFFLAYIHGQPLLYDMGKLVPMALSTSFSFLMLTIGIIAIDKHNLLHRLFANDSPSSHLIQFIVPFTLIIVVVSGLVENYLMRQSSVYSSALISSLSLISIFIFSSILSIKLTRKLTYLQDRNKRYLRRYMHMVNTSSDMFALVDSNYMYQAANPSYLKMFNLTSNQIIGLHPRDLFGDKHFNLTIKKNALRAMTGESINFEQYIDFPTKKNVYMSMTYTPYLNDEGKIDGFVINGRDISVQKENLMLLEYANIIIEKSSVVLFRWQAKAHWPVDYVSNNVSLFGYSPEDFLSGKIVYPSIIHPDDLSRVIAEVSYHTEKLSSTFQHDYRIISANGDIFWLDDRTSIERDDEGNVVYYQGTIIDITQQKLAQLQLDVSSKKIKTQQYEQLQILNAIYDAIISVDEQGTVLTMNQSTSRLFGFTSKELLGENVNILRSDATSKEDIDIIHQYLHTDTDHTNIISIEVVGKHKSNSTFPMRLSITELPKNETGKRRFIAVCQDLTKIKHQEELFNRSQKMKALGQLTGGLAHDYNNMLAVVIGYSDILKVDLKDQPNPLKYIEQISLAADRGAELTRKLLSFARLKPAQTKAVNVNTLIIQNRDLLQKTLPTITLNIELSDELWLTNIESHSFDDMLLNLAINAMHAMGNGGKLSITTSNESLSKTKAKNYAISPGDYVSISIEDNGCGMSADILSKIFDPFFSTKGNNGSGLGLAQVYGFIKSSGGAINVYSEQGLGSRFLIYLPRDKEKYADEIVKKKYTHTELSGNESILVVDDENQLCELAEMILLDHGYKVLTALSGEHALVLLKDNHIDLMLSDIIMPKMSGYELAAQVVKLYPNIEIIHASGFQGDQIKPTLKLSHPIIDKPYNSQQVLSSIRQCLDKRLFRT